jgi:hypothetical protein
MTVQQEVEKYADWSVDFYAWVHEKNAEHNSPGCMGDKTSALRTYGSSPLTTESTFPPMQNSVASKRQKVECFRSSSVYARIVEDSSEEEDEAILQRVMRKANSKGKGKGKNPPPPVPPNPVLQSLAISAAFPGQLKEWMATSDTALKGNTAVLNATQTHLSSLAANVAASIVTTMELNKWTTEQKKTVFGPPQSQRQRQRPGP